MKFELLVSAILIGFAITVVVSFMIGLSIVNNAAYAIEEHPVYPISNGIVIQHDYDNAHKIYDKVLYTGTDVKLVEDEGKKFLITSEYTVLGGELTGEDFNEYWEWSWGNR